MATFLVVALLLGSAYVIVRVAATADGYSVRRLAMLAAGIALVQSCAWIFILQPFHGADESEHFAYMQHLAATHRIPDRAPSAKSPYSSSQLRLMEAVHHNSTILNATSRPRWDAYYDKQYEHALERGGLSNADGGGYTESASGHSALYYSIVALPYALMGQPEDLTNAILVIRLFNAIAAAMIAALAVMTAALMFRQRRDAAWFAGVLVATQPVFASVSAAVNNDTGVNLVAAAVIYVLIRVWRQGLRAKDAVGLGALAILMPIMKITGAGVLPAIVVAVAVLALRYGAVPTVRWSVVASLSALVIAASWIFLAAPLIGGEKGRLVNTHPGAIPTANATMVATATQPPAVQQLSTTPVGRLQYALKTFLPVAPGPERWALSGKYRLQRWPAFRIYVERGYGFYGWNSTGGLPYNTLVLVFGGLLVGWALSFAAAFQRRKRWRAWAGGAAILIAAVVSVLAFVGYAYAKPTVVTEPGEQGRYLFTAIVPLGVLLAGSALALRGRMAAVALGAGVTAAWSVGAIGWLTAVRAWYM